MPQPELIGRGSHMGDKRRRAPLQPVSSAKRSTGRPRTCPHLGLDADPLSHEPRPSDAHRCYFARERDRIDLAHQESFCLTGDHRRCPWLVIKYAELPRWRRAMRRLDEQAFQLRKRLAWSRRAVAMAGGGVAAAIAAGTLAVALAHGAWHQRPAPAVPALTASPAPAPAADALPASVLASEPRDGEVLVPTDTGGVAVGGNLGISFGARALAGIPGPLRVRIQTNPTGIPVLDGPTRLSANATLLRLTATDANGREVTTFPALITLSLKYSSADLAMGSGDVNQLTAGYVIDESSPAIANPLRFPAGTWLFFPPSQTSLDAASDVITVRTQALPRTIGVVARPFRYVQTQVDGTQLISSFRNDAETFGTRQRLTCLEVVGPQINGRLIVLDLSTNNYAYVSAGDVAASSACGR